MIDGRVSVPILFLVNRNVARLESNTERTTENRKGQWRLDGSRKERQERQENKRAKEHRKEKYTGQLTR